MRVRWTLVLAAALGAGGLAAAPAEAGAGDYEYVVIYESTDELRPQSCPALNNAGQVGFTVAATEGYGRLVLRGDGAALTTIAEDDFRRSDFKGVSINDSGEVAFRTRTPYTRQRGIYVGAGAGLREVATNKQGFNGFNSFSINEQGSVAFDAPREADGGFGLYVARRPLSLQTLYTNRDDGYAGPPGSYTSNVSFRDDALAFTAKWEESRPLGVFRQTREGELTTIAQVDDTIEFLEGVSMNDHGEVAFKAVMQGAEPGQAGRKIMAGSGGPLRTIAESGTAAPFKGFSAYEPPSINNAGTVSFVGWTRDTSRNNRGVYIGADPDADRVVGPGDIIDGKEILSASSCQEGLNDAGQAAFAATTVDLQRFIVRADPV